MIYKLLSQFFLIVILQAFGFRYSILYFHMVTYSALLSSMKLHKAPLSSIKHHIEVRMPELPLKGKIPIT